MLSSSMEAAHKNNARSIFVPGLPEYINVNATNGPTDVTRLKYGFPTAKNAKLFTA